MKAMIKGELMEFKDVHELVRFLYPDKTVKKKKPRRKRG